ncbi:MAG: lysoplasmalogenase [Spirochaetales bacterium]|nr:lysoplasmalogenase [Spirochaetales bacterium]
MNLLPFLLISLIHLAGEALHIRALHYVTKPLLLPALGLYYFLTVQNPSLFIAGALLFGWLGDILLMVPVKRNPFFLGGLLLFLAGHLCYAAAFLGSATTDSLIGAVLGGGFVVYGILVYYKLGPRLGRFQFPVILYISAIALMGVSAAFCMGSQRPGAVLTVVAGALVFMISDNLLAWNRFVGPVRFEGVLGMSAYLTGQLLIVAGYMQFKPA